MLAKGSDYQQTFFHYVGANREANEKMVVQVQNVG